MNQLHPSEQEIVMRPIIFSTEMVRAILDGRKFQTRRIIKESYNGLDWDRDKHNWVEGFKAGVGLLQGFAEWLLKENYHNSGNGNWLKIGKSRSVLYTTEEIIAKYIQFITDKQKNNEQGNKIPGMGHAK